MQLEVHTSACSIPVIERFHLHSNRNVGHVDEQETCGYNSYT